MGHIEILFYSFIICFKVGTIAAATNENIFGIKVLNTENTKLQVYYECLCPYCREFFRKNLAPSVNKIAEYLDIELYPYGNAQTTVHTDGTFNIKCQHGPLECYGNQLHACLIDEMRNITAATLFNACMMEGDDDINDYGSNDKAAKMCGDLMKFDVKSVIECAGSELGKKLQKNNGDKTVKHPGVPWIVINGKAYDFRTDFWTYLCKSFKQPPPACSSQ